MLWNTGCNNIGNGLKFGINILDGEDQKLAITVPALQSADWRSTIFPWCVNAQEVKSKAFRVANIELGTTRPFLYLFQDYRTHRICWSLVKHANPWDSRTGINDGQDSPNPQVPLSAIDIFIMADKVWGLPAQSENQVFQTVFDRVVALASAVGSIAQAGGAAAA
jgi:hypothetical protein